jgi:SPRY domain
MVAIRLLLTTTYIAALTYGRVSRIIHHRVTYNRISRLSMQSSTPNEKIDSEIAKQALSDYIANIRSKMLLYRHHQDFTVIENNSSIKVSVTKGGISYRGLIWDKSICEYSVKIDASSFLNNMIGFAPSKLFDVSEFDYNSCGWYLALWNGSLYAQNTGNGIGYSTGCKVGDTITCIYNSSSSEISFVKNGWSLGVAYTNVKGEDIAPAVALAYVGDSLTLSAIPNQYQSTFAIILSCCMNYIFIFGMLIRYLLKLKTYSLK